MYYYSQLFYTVTRMFSTVIEISLVLNGYLLRRITYCKLFYSNLCTVTYIFLKAFSQRNFSVSACCLTKNL